MSPIVVSGFMMATARAAIDAQPDGARVFFVSPR